MVNTVGQHPQNSFIEKCVRRVGLGEGLENSLSRILNQVFHYFIELKNNPLLGR